MADPSDISTPRDMSEKRALPKHVAIIMDGNGRWALQRKLPRFEGHRQGVEAIRRVVESAGNLGIPFLTFYAFSTENWRRPAAEVSFLMKLLTQFIATDLKKIHDKNIRIQVIGSAKGVAPDIFQLIDEATRLTAKNTGITLIFAFNYGAWEELVDATNALLDSALATASADAQKDGAQKDGAQNGGAQKPITEQDIRKHLFTANIPDPDLLIRTSGEQRLSNFLLMQCAYTEMVFQTVLWPDYTQTHFEAALEEFFTRDRRYGDIGAHVDENAPENAPENAEEGADELMKEAVS